jgi:L,D-transpeptidase YbiS
MEPSQNSVGDAAPASPNAGPDTAPADGSAGVTPPAAAAPPPRGPAPAWRDRRVVWAAAAAASLLCAVGVAGTGYRYEPFAPGVPAPTGTVPADERGLKQLTAKLKARERDLRLRLKASAPRGVYIVIDQTHNRLYLKKDDETLLEAVCSAGSGMVLRESGGKKREWVFDTPRGRFEVLSRTANPVWKKPDWAFVEEGEAIPKNPAERLDYGSLGEYALYFGNGFMIHGTLYERLLGRAVSHGCIRVGRDDLRQVWANTRIGTRIYIY